MFGWPDVVYLTISLVSVTIKFFVTFAESKTGGLHFLAHF